MSTLDVPSIYWHHGTAASINVNGNLYLISLQ